MAKSKKKIQSLDDLTPDPANVNKGSERGHFQLDWSLTELGAGRSILADADGVVLAGNKTLEVAADHGLPVRVVETDGRELVVVQRTDLRLQGEGEERTKARQLAIADNRVSETSYTVDVETLLAHAQTVDISALYRQDEIDALLASLEPELPAPGGGGDEFDATPEETQTRVRRGDLWELGDHRLLCGDSTKAEDVARVMNGEKSHLVVTSPPYFNQRPEYSTWPDYESFNGFIGQIADRIIETAGSPFVIAWNTGDNQPDCLPMIADQTVLLHTKGLTYLDTIIWRKAGAVYSIPRSAHIRTHNCFYPALAWEPIVIFRFGDKMPKFEASDVDTVSSYGVNVWDINQVNGNIQRETGHPAMYPVELPERIIRCYSVKCSIVFEPFGGSGTTLIACERTNRKARVIEIEPKYCNVILSRWEAETGRQAKLLERADAK